MKKLILIFCLLIIQNLYSSDGTLDKLTFNAPNGFIISPSPGIANAVAIQTDGKIVAGGSSPGQFEIARYNTDGTLESTTTSASILGTITGIVIQPDGKIVAAGINGANIQVVRYNTDLSVDTIFTLIPGLANAVVIQTDGKIVVAGRSGTSFITARFNTDGTPDTTFGPGGIATGPNFTGTAFDLILQADGKIVATGSNDVPMTTGLLTVRYNTNGTIDPTFGPGGSVTTPNGLSFAIVIQPDGKIIIAGSNTAVLGTFQVIRYTPTGSLDTTFNGTGIFTNSGNAADLNIQSDGKIIVYGSTPTAMIQLVRLTTSGTLDPSFGMGGIVQDPVIIALDLAGALQQNGKIVAVGVVPFAAGFFISRYLNNAPLIATTITSPTNNQNISSGSVTFTGTAQNPSNVYLFLNGVLIGGVVTDPSGSNTWSFTTTGLTAGTYTLQAVSIYKDGRVNIASDTITFTIGSINPLPTNASQIVSAIISKYCLRGL